MYHLCLWRNAYGVHRPVVRRPMRSSGRVLLITLQSRLIHQTRDLPMAARPGATARQNPPTGLGVAKWIVVFLWPVKLGLMLCVPLMPQKDAPYTLVIMWALYGIYLKRSQDILPEKGILFVSQFGIYVCAFSVLFLLIRKWSISRQ